MRDCGCTKKRRSVNVVTKRYSYRIEGEFCRHEMEALLSSMSGVRDVFIGEDIVTFQAAREFSQADLVHALADLGVQVKIAAQR